MKLYVGPIVAMKKKVIDVRGSKMSSRDHAISIRVPRARCGGFTFHHESFNLTQRNR